MNKLNCIAYTVNISVISNNSVQFWQYVRVGKKFVEWSRVIGETGTEPLDGIGYSELQVDMF